MGVRLIYDEATRQLKKLGWRDRLNVEGVRRVSAGPLRYCLEGNMLYLPQDEDALDPGHRLCWGYIDELEYEANPWLSEWDTPLPKNPLDLAHPRSGNGFGVKYSRRHYESAEGRVAVNEFVAESLLAELHANPDALPDVSKEDFEKLVAELFARKGFQVDLFRKSKDDGIDFLAVHDDGTQPIVVAVQTKHPDPEKNGRSRATLPVATVREVYGVASAWNLHGAIAVTSSTYSPAAKKFADLKPDAIQVHDGADVLAWIKAYRWNQDE